MGCCESRGWCPGLGEPVAPDEDPKQLTEDCELFALGQRACRWYFRLGRAGVVVFAVDCWQNEGRVLKSWTLPAPPAAVTAVRYLGVSEEKSVVGVEVGGEAGGAWALDGDVFFWTPGGLLPHAVNRDAITVHQGALAVRRLHHERRVPTRDVPRLAQLWATVRPAQVPRDSRACRMRSGYVWLLAKTGAMWAVPPDEGAPAYAYRSFDDTAPEAFALPPWAALHPGGDGFAYLEAAAEPKVVHVNSAEVVCAAADGLIVVENTGDPFVVDGDVVNVVKLSRVWAAARAGAGGRGSVPAPGPADPFRGSPYSDSPYSGSPGATPEASPGASPSADSSADSPPDSPPVSSSAGPATPLPYAKPRFPDEATPLLEPIPTRARPRVPPLALTDPPAHRSQPRPHRAAAASEPQLDDAGLRAKRVERGRGADNRRDDGERGRGADNRRDDGEPDRHGWGRDDAWGRGERSDARPLAATHSARAIQLEVPREAGSAAAPRGPSPGGRPHGP